MTIWRIPGASENTASARMCRCNEYAPSAHRLSAACPGGVGDIDFRGGEFVDRPSGEKKLMPTARTSDFVNRLSIRPPGSLGSSCGHYNNGGSAHACCHVPVGVVVRSVLALRLNSFGNIQSPFPCWRSLAQ